MTRDEKTGLWVLVLAVALGAMISMITVAMERQNDELRAQVEAHRLEIKELREAMAFVEQQGK